MNIKIQGGGGGAYANTGSSIGAVNYLEHEDVKQLQEGKEQEHFFTHDKKRVSAQETTYKIDNNKKGVGANRAKFFVVTVSPSEKEIKAMGKTEAERIKNFKQYINQGVMNEYAKNFKTADNKSKLCSEKDLMFYAKVHHTRGNKEGEQMHAHIIVSRKDISGKMQISPGTPHREAKRGGAVKSSFSREDFFNKSEIAFDLGFNHSRDFKNSFEFQNTMKNGKMEDVKQLPKRELQFNQMQERIQEIHQEARQEQTHDHKQEQEQTQTKSRGIGR